MGKKLGGSKIIKVKIKDMMAMSHFGNFEGIDIHTPPEYKKTNICFSEIPNIL